MKRQFFILTVIAGFSVLVGLGIWQWERRAWKQAMLTEIDAGLASPPVAISNAANKTLAWHPVRAYGSWATEGLIHVAPVTLLGKVGKVYAAPFRLEDGSIVAVELGWAGNQLNGITLPETVKSIEGVLIPARKPSYFTPDNQPPNNWYWLDPIALAQNAGLNSAKAAPLILRLTQSPEGLTTRPAKPDIPDNHLQYAFTWFGLAIAWAVIGFLALRKSQE
jgi:surfeit locus 1 family protein